MSVIKVKWVVDELANVMSQFDVQKVYWSATEAGVYAEATDPSTRVAFAAGQTLYYFDHLSGDPSYWYKVSYYNTVTLQESDPSDPFQASAAGGYTTLEAVRAAGITVSQASDAAVLEQIVMWSQFMDRACKQWFEPRYLDIKVDGNGARILWLQVPIIGIDELYMNADWVNAVDASYYEVYNNLGDGVSDDRRNPRIGLSDTMSQSIFTAVSSRDLFVEGKKNQRVKGTFGFVEPDGSTPGLISRATLKMVVKILGSGSISPTPSPAGSIVSETTDGHTIRYGSIIGTQKAGTIGITGDPEVEGIIQLYRAPKAMAVVA